MIASQSKLKYFRLKALAYIYNFFWLSSISSHAFEYISSSQLAISSSSEHEQSSLAQYSSMSSTTDYFLDWLIECKFFWLIQITSIPVTQLAVIPIAPSKCLTFIVQKCRVLFAARYVNHLSCTMRQIDLNWKVVFVNVGLSSPKLSISIGSPGIYLSILVQSHCVIHTTLNLDDVLQSLNLSGQIHLIPISMAQSSTFAISPCIYFPISSQACRVLKSTSNLSDNFIFELARNVINCVVIGNTPWAVGFIL